MIRGFGWRYTLFPSTGPQKGALDRLFPDRPVLLAAIDGHSAWVNSKALERAGITAKTKDPVPAFSTFARDPKTGELTGWLVEGPAMLQVFFKLDPPTTEAVLAAMAEQLPKCSAAGLTAVFDAGMQMLANADLGFQGYQQLERQGRLPVQVVGSSYRNNPGIANPLPIIRKLRDRYQSELVQAPSAEDQWRRQRPCSTRLFFCCFAPPFKGCVVLPYGCSGRHHGEPWSRAWLRRR